MLVTKDRECAFVKSLEQRLAQSDDPAAIMNMLWTKQLGYADNEGHVPALKNSRKMDLDRLSKDKLANMSEDAKAKLFNGVAFNYANLVTMLLRPSIDAEVNFQNAQVPTPKSFAQIIMGVLFNGGASVQKMFDDNFGGADRLSILASAKATSKEVGGSFFEFVSTTMDRLVRGAHVLGENDAGDIVLFMAEIGVPPPEEGLETLYRVALQANWLYGGTSGSTLTINPEDGSLWLEKYTWLERLDGDKALEMVDRFADVANTWKELVANFRPDVETPSSSLAIDLA